LILISYTKGGERMTDRQKRQIEALRKKGQSYATIGKELGISPNSVKSFCQRAGGKIFDTVCRNCGAPLNRNPRAKEKSFCSNHCRQTWWNANREQINHHDNRIATCACCGAEFEMYGKRERKYCSRYCASADRDKLTKRGSGELKSVNHQ
jgi:predicted transcriptional regulator